MESASQSAKASRHDQKLAGILAAAAEVFAEEGYDRASIRSVAERAGVSVPGLYHYVRSKEELLYLIQVHVFGDLVQQYKQQCGTCTTRSTGSDSSCSTSSSASSATWLSWSYARVNSIDWRGNLRRHRGNAARVLQSATKCSRRDSKTVMEGRVWILARLPWRCSGVRKRWSSPVRSSSRARQRPRGLMASSATSFSISAAAWANCDVRGMIL